MRTGLDYSTHLVQSDITLNLADIDPVANSCLEIMLSSTLVGEKVIAVLAERGRGKTTLLQRLVWELSTADASASPVRTDIFDLADDAALDELAVTVRTDFPLPSVAAAAPDGAAAPAEGAHDHRRGRAAATRRVLLLDHVEALTGPDLDRFVTVLEQIAAAEAAVTAVIAVGQDRDDPNAAARQMRLVDLADVVVRMRPLADPEMSPVIRRCLGEAGFPDLGQRGEMIVDTITRLAKGNPIRAVRICRAAASGEDLESVLSDPVLSERSPAGAPEPVPEPALGPGAAAFHRPPHRSPANGERGGDAVSRAETAANTVAAAGAERSAAMTPDPAAVPPAPAADATAPLPATFRSPPPPRVLSSPDAPRQPARRLWPAALLAGGVAVAALALASTQVPGVKAEIDRALARFRGERTAGIDASEAPVPLAAPATPADTAAVVVATPAPAPVTAVAPVDAPASPPTTEPAAEPTATAVDEPAPAPAAETAAAPASPSEPVGVGAAVADSAAAPAAAETGPTAAPAAGDGDVAVANDTVSSGDSAVEDVALTPGDGPIIAGLDATGPVDTIPAVPGGGDVVAPAAAAESIAAWLGQGDVLLDLGDIASARSFYLLAAEAGSPVAATRAGMTFDPVFQRERSVVGGLADPRRALLWYKAGAVAGDEDADRRLMALVTDLRDRAGAGHAESADALRAAGF